MIQRLLCVCLLCGVAIPAAWSQAYKPFKKKDFRPMVLATLKPLVLQQAVWALKQAPVTITSSIAQRSAGGKHDFYSEGDYWWPNPAHPDSPYVQKDGMTNPDNFVAHRQAMIRFSRIMGALGSAYTITKQTKYVAQALKHCSAWFVDTATFMNPSLLYAQAIKGKATGRGIGIIDTIHLMEVVMALLAMEDSKAMDATLLAGVRHWFEQYIAWLTTHPYGKDEMNAANNHGTCWVMQVAAFATFTGDTAMLNFCRERFKKVLLPTQFARNGTFPLEVKRTKPYGYSLFNMDAMATLCRLLSTPQDNLWDYHEINGPNMSRQSDFHAEVVYNKSRWPFAKDVMYWDNWPVAQPFLLFAGEAYAIKPFVELWQKKEHAPMVEEVFRNLPVRNPLIW